MYKVSDISESVSSVTTSTTKTQIKSDIDKAKEARERKLKIRESYHAQGYILADQLDNQEFIDAMNQIDKDWVDKSGYAEYQVTYKNIHGGYNRVIIRVPALDSDECSRIMSSILKPDVFNLNYPDVDPLFMDYQVKLIKRYKVYK